LLADKWRERPEGRALGRQSSTAAAAAAGLMTANLVEFVRA